MELTDIPSVAALAHENADHIGRFMAPPQADLSEHLRFLTRLYLNSELGRRQEFIINRDDELVGRTGMQAIDELKGQWEVFIWVARAATGIGVGGQTLTLLCDMALASPDIDRLWCRIWQGNHASRHIFETAGFTFGHKWPAPARTQGMWVATKAV